MVLLSTSAVSGEDYGATRAGQELFAAHCVRCHGATAEGDGPLASSLRVEPANLTLLKQKNGGTFPFEAVVKKIDGTEKIKGHGSSDMPIWGIGFMEADDSATAQTVQDKVRALASYLETIQTAEDSD